MYPITISTLGDLIDSGDGLSGHCGNSPACGRSLDLDVYDLAIQFGRRQCFVDMRIPVRCASCGSRDIRWIMSPDTRPHHCDRSEPTNFRRTRSATEREALKVVFPKIRP